jgi:integrase
MPSGERRKFTDFTLGGPEAGRGGAAKWPDRSRGCGESLGSPNIRQKGTRLGNWLTREQAKALLAVPDRSTLKGKRDYVILALLGGCALRRQELATLDVETIQLRKAAGSWLISKGREDAFAWLRSRSGSNRESTPG